MTVDFAALRSSTAPALLVRRARTEPRAIAFRSKHLGIYRERTWADYAGLVAGAAKGLKALGVRRGDRIAIMAEVCEEWLVADQAAQALGAIVYGIYPTAALAEVEYQMQDGGAKVFIAEDQEFLDKIMPVVERLPALEALLVFDETALGLTAHPRLSGWNELCAAHADADLDWLAAEAAMVRPSDPAFIVYTSGTTGHPKGALVAHGKHLAATGNIVTHYPALGEREQRTVVHLPLCHVLGRDVAVTLPLISRLVPHFGEEPDDLPSTLFEVAPTVMFMVPRLLQKLAAQVLIGISSTTSVKRTSYDMAMRFGRAHARRRWDGTTTAAQEAMFRFWRAAVFRPVLNKLGLDRIELMISGGAPLPDDTAAIWQAFGVNVVEMYGQTETAGGIIAGQKGPFPKPGDVGTVPDGWSVTLGPDGEVRVATPDLFEGYWNNPQATAAVFTTDGLLLTGDIAEWRDGRLKLVDRARDFIVTSGGKTISPSYVENIVRASPYVAEVVVIGHARKYLTALIEIEFDTVADWARANDVNYTGFTSLASSPKIAALIRSEIAKSNSELARVEQIKDFRILPKELDPEEEGEPVTPTRKVKRGQMQERFKSLVESMYDDKEERLLSEAAGRTSQRI